MLQDQEQVVLVWSCYRTEHRLHTYRAVFFYNKLYADLRPGRSRFSRLGQEMGYKLVFFKILSRLTANLLE